MAAAWKFQQQVGNAGWVDVFWTFATGAMAVVGTLWPLPGAEDLPARRYIVAALAAAWAIRLGLHLRARVRSRPEDARYAGFRRDWGARFQTRLFWFLQIQAFAAWPLAVAITLAARNPASVLRATDVVAMAIIAIALIGEMLSDRQLARFVADPGSAGRVCDRGLWAWSGIQTILRVPGLVCLAAVRVQCGLAARLAGLGCACHDVLVARACLGYSSTGASDAGIARRRLSCLPKPHQRVSSTPTAKRGRRMNVIATTTSVLERIPLPDQLLRLGISRLAGALTGGCRRRPRHRNNICGLNAGASDRGTR